MFVVPTALDRIPGDADVLAQGGQELDAMADTLRDLAARLDEIARDDLTIGEAADAMRARTNDAASRLREVEPRYAETAIAVQDFSVRLIDVQRRFDEAHGVVRTEDESIRYFQREIWEIESQAVRLAMLMPDPERQAEDARRLVYLRRELAAHRAARDNAEARLDAAVQDWDEAARTAASRIRPALSALNDGLLDYAAAFVDGLGDFFAAVAEWIVTVLDTLLTSFLLLVVLAVALVVMASLVLVLVHLLMPFLLSGALTLDQIVEFLVGITLVIVPFLTSAVAFLMLREAMTPTPTVSPVIKTLGGRVVQRQDQSEYEYIFARNAELDDIGGKDNTVVEVVQVLDERGRPALDENGNPIWRVTLPSTQDWQLILGGALGDNGAVNDLGSNLALILTPDQQAAYERAVLQAMREAGIGPNDSVMLAGWSQGGILAGAIASDPNSGFNIRAVVVAGAPIDHMPIPSDVSVVAIQHDNDQVPRLDGIPPRQEANWVTITEPSSGEGYPHNPAHYAETARTFDTDACLAEYPTLAGIREDQGMFFSENEVGYLYEFAETDSAIS